MVSAGRRAALKGAALGTFAFTVGGAQVWLSLREAHAQGVALKVLNPAEAAALEAFGDTLLPGAREAGIAQYVDHQLAGPAEDCLLAARAANVPPPVAGFYRAGLAALDASAREGFKKTFAELEAADRIRHVDQLRQKNPQGWNGPPSPFFYFLVRNDAVDVVYGTVEGFERLGVPYMPHIAPPARW